MKMFCAKEGKIGLCGKYVFWLSSTYGANKDDCLKLIQKWWERATVEERFNRMLLDCEKH